MNDNTQNMICMEIRFPEFLKKMSFYANKILEHSGQLNEFELQANQIEILKQMYYYLNNLPAFKGEFNKGLALLGDIGTGKSLLLKSFIHLVINHYQKIYKSIDDEYKIYNIHWRASRYFTTSENYKDGSNPIIEYFNQSVCIDDLGKEPLKFTVYNETYQPIRELIENISSHNSKLFFTSNLTKNELKDYYHDSTYDRLKLLVNFFAIEGESLRK
jgi:DNA replication protein DnaC